MACKHKCMYVCISGFKRAHPRRSTGSHRSRRFRWTFRISRNIQLVIVSRYHNRAPIPPRMFVSFVGYESRTRKRTATSRKSLWVRDLENGAACKVCHASWKLRFFSTQIYVLPRSRGNRYSCKSWPRNVSRSKVTAFRKCSEIPAARGEAGKNWKRK